jgi:hypothetical protein
MSDFNSSLPVRTENPGDVVSKLADATTPSQQLAITAAGEARTLDSSDGPVTPGAAATFASLIAGQYNTILPVLTTGQQAAIQVDSSGRILVNTSNTDDHNYGVVGANTLRTAAQIGNATGAADFNNGATGPQTLRVAANQGTSPWVTSVTNLPATTDTNYGVVGPNTLRTASQIGNATGAADFNFGTVGAQTLRVAAEVGNATGINSATNPLFVTESATSGTSVNDYKDAVAIASGASDNHDYTVTAGKTLYLDQIESSGSGKAKMMLAIETGVATGVFTTRFVQFNSTATSDMSLHLANAITVPAGVRVRVTMTNRDLLAADLYSTISGSEI